MCTKQLQLRCRMKPHPYFASGDRRGDRIIEGTLPSSFSTELGVYETRGLYARLFMWASSLGPSQTLVRHSATSAERWFGNTNSPCCCCRGFNYQPSRCWRDGWISLIEKILPVDKRLSSCGRSHLRTISCQHQITMQKKYRQDASRILPQLKKCSGSSLVSGVSNGVSAMGRFRKLALPYKCSWNLSVLCKNCMLCVGLM